MYRLITHLLLLLLLVVVVVVDTPTIKKIIFLNVKKIQTKIMDVHTNIIGFMKKIFFVGCVKRQILVLQNYFSQGIFRLYVNHTKKRETLCGYRISKYTTTGIERHIGNGPKKPSAMEKGSVSPTMSLT